VPERRGLVGEEERGEEREQRIKGREREWRVENEGKKWSIAYIYISNWFGSPGTNPGLNRTGPICNPLSPEPSILL
jgi:hypothetical protein